MKLYEIILLAAIPGLMFCIIPAEGMPLAFSWQLISIWLGGVAFITVLSSWWWRGFFLLALIRTATILPAQAEAYLELMTIAVFLSAAEGFRRMNPRYREFAMDGMCVAAELLLMWMLWQKCGIIRSDFAPQHAGPFNPDVASIFFALTIFACTRTKRWWLLPPILSGMVVVATTTGVAAAAAGAIVYALKSGWSKKVMAIGLMVLLMGGIVWSWRVDSLENMVTNPRWIAWKHAAWSMRSEQWGRGLGSWYDTFPLLASGDRRIGTVELKDGKLEMNNVFLQADNEYVQAAFELGLQALLLIVCFLAITAWMIVRNPVSASAAGGITTLAVACFGVYCFHVPPIAVLGSAWLGIWEAERKPILKFAGGTL